MDDVSQGGVDKKSRRARLEARSPGLQARRTGVGPLRFRVGQAKIGKTWYETKTHTRMHVSLHNEPVSTKRCSSPGDRHQPTGFCLSINGELSSRSGHTALETSIVEKHTAKREPSLAPCSLRLYMTKKRRTQILEITHSEQDCQVFLPSGLPRHMP